MKKTERHTPKNSLPALSFHKTKKLFYVRLNGQCLYLGKDRHLAEQKYHRTIAEWLTRGKQSPAPPPDELTMAELADRYMAYCIDYYQRAPQNLCRVRASLSAVAAYLDVRTTEFGPLQLQAVRNELISKGLVRRYINETIQGIVRMFRWGVSQELIHTEVHQKLCSVPGLRRGFSNAVESRRRQPITAAELDAITPFMTRPVEAALRVMYLTGARPSEILNLRPRDIDRSGDVWRAEIEDHKTAHLGKRRVLFFGPRCQRVMRPYLLRGEDEYMFSPKEAMEEYQAERHAKRKTPLSCGNTPGSNRRRNPETSPTDHFHHSVFRRCITKAVTKANADRARNGLEPIRRDICPYECRHSVATRIREEVSLDATAAVLGHSRINMSEHYARVSEELARETMSRIG